jgi:hypothetical protein
MFSMYSRATIRIESSRREVQEGIGYWGYGISYEMGSPGEGYSEV